jgi:hypothetical protein
MVGLEALGMNLEDIFISVVDTTEGREESAPTTKKNTGRRAPRRTRTSLEASLAEGMVKDAEEKRESDAQKDVSYDE